MKKASLLFAILFFVPLCASAQPVSPYMALRAGATKIKASSYFVNDRKDTVPFISVAAGLENGGFFRIEAENMYLSKAKFGYDSVAMKVTGKSHAFMLNAYLNFSTKTPFTPFVGFGVGSASNYIKADTKGKWSTDFAFNIGGGVSIKASEYLNIEVAYRYIDLGEADNGTTSVDYRANQFYGGLRYMF